MRYGWMPFAKRQFLRNFEIIRIRLFSTSMETGTTFAATALARILQVRAETSFSERSEVPHPTPLAPAHGTRIRPQRLRI